MPQAKLHALAAEFKGKIEPLQFQKGLRVLLHRDQWRDFFVALHAEESLRAYQLRMLTAKKSNVGAVVFAELCFAPSGDRFVVLCELSLADTLPSLTDVWSYADWMEQEIFEMYGIRVAGVNKEKRMFLKFKI